MKNWIWAYLVWIALAASPISDVKAETFMWRNNLELSEGKAKKELLQSLNGDNPNEITLQWVMEVGSLTPISARIITNAALNYFDEEVKLYSLKWEARKKVEQIMMEYLSAHPILKMNSDWDILFLIDNKKEFASMIKNLANTLFDWMPKVIRDIAIWIAFGWNEELQKTLNNLDSTVMNLPIKQYKDIVFDYFWGIVKRVASSMEWEITVRDYYDSVNKYYPNKNCEKIWKELEKTWQLDDNMVVLKYPFKK